jgi:hypothetical protein
VWANQAKKTVRNYAEAGPARLQRLERYVDRVVGKVAWERSAIDDRTVKKYEVGDECVPGAD